MVRKLTTSEFIKRARNIHGNKYDYSKVEYIGAVNKVCIICPKHGEFWQSPSNHTHGAGCEKCYREMLKSTTAAFVAKAIAIYGNKYDYSKVEYKGNKDKVIVICKKHGEFLVSPNSHLRGSECPTCYGTPKKTTEQFINEAIAKHGNKYDYSKVEYQGNKKKVCIICPEHGEFWQGAAAHLNGAGCPACSNCEKIDSQSFIRRSQIIHNMKYDYSKVEFQGLKKEVVIICPEHGEFLQKPYNHIRGYGCQLCGGSLRLTNEDFIKKANKIHKGKYDYTKVNYVNTSTKVCIICPEHGEFWQTPNNHLFGVGCPACTQSQLEEEVRELLTIHKISFEAQKTFPWLRFKKKMFLDFFLPEYGIAIECQGRQLFGPSDYYGGMEEFKIEQQRDTKKKELCESHDITMIYYSHLGIDYPYDVIESSGLLIKAIKDKGILKNLKKWLNPQLELEFKD